MPESLLAHIRLIIANINHTITAIKAFSKMNVLSESMNPRSYHRSSIIELLIWKLFRQESNNFIKLLTCRLMLLTNADGLIEYDVQLERTKYAGVQTHVHLGKSRWCWIAMWHPFWYLFRAQFLLNWNFQCQASSYALEKIGPYTSVYFSLLFVYLLYPFPKQIEF